MLQIDFIGYSATHPDGFVYDIESDHDFYLLVLTASPAKFRVNQQMVTYPAGYAILFTPGSSIRYQSADQDYKNDWIRFRTDEPFAEALSKKDIPFQVNDYEYCHNLIKLITWESSFSSPGSEMILSHLMYSLFLKLNDSLNGNKELSAHAADIIALHKKIYNNPQLPWSVRQMAEELHLSAGYLQMLYKNMFGSSCMDDVIEGRLRRAKDQLNSSDKSILEIAENCGYKNVEHFCRQFRQYVGLTPSHYRIVSREKQANQSIAHLTLGGLEFTRETLT